MKTKSKTALGKRQPQCPHCHHPITVEQALLVLRGDGFVKHHKVRSRTTGQEFILEETSINPLEMEVLTDVRTSPGP